MHSGLRFLTLSGMAFGIRGIMVKRMSDNDSPLTPADPFAVVDAASDRPPVLPALGRSALSDGPRIVAGLRLNRDHDLQRDVVCQSSAVADATADAHLLSEVRLRARIQHPNGGPVLLSLERAEDGRLVAVALPLPGLTLQAALDEAAHGRPHPLLTSLAGRLDLIRRLADVVATAHAEGVLHHHIGPETIHLGRPGEIVLAGWHLPEDQDSHHILGDPAYSAPEVERGEAPSEHSDLFALAAVAFRLLIGRPPLHSTRGTGSWTRKMSGDIDAPTPAEAARLPPALVEVVTRALAADPQRRQPSVLAFARDLDRVQSDGLDQLTTSARNPNPQDVRRRRWRAVSAAVVFLVLGALLVTVPRSPTTTWGEPLALGSPGDSAWSTQWETLDGTFTAHQGVLRTGVGNAHVLAMRRRLIGPVAIEFTGSFPATAQPGDVSILWLPSYGQMDQHGRRYNVGSALRFQVGAYDNTFVAITLGEHLAYRGKRLESDRPYRIRVEIDGDQATLRIDGELVCRARVPFPLPAGHLALFGYYPDKFFRDITVWNRPPPTSLPPLALGNDAFQAGDFPRAAEHYRRLTEAYAEEPLGLRARFLLGLTQERLGQREAAERIWTSLERTELAGEALLERLRLRLGDADAPTILDDLQRAWDAWPDLHSTIVQRWARGLTVQVRPPDTAGDLDRWLAFQTQRFPDDPLAREAAAAALIRHHRPEAVLSGYPDQRPWVARALVYLGRHAEVRTGYSDQRQVMLNVLLDLGEFATLVRDYPENRWATALAFIASGRAEELAKGDHDHRLDGLLALGRTADVLADPTATLEQQVEAHLLNDDVAAALTLSDAHPHLRDRCLLFLNELDQLSSAHHNRTAAALAAFAQADRAHLGTSLTLLDQLRVGTFQQRNNPAALGIEIGSVWLALFQQGPAEARMRLLALAAAPDPQLGQGTIAALAGLALHVDGGGNGETAFAAQPVQHGLAARRLLAEALRADLAGDAAHAVSRLRAWQALPLHQRGFPREPVIEGLVRWRLGFSP